MGFIRYLPQYRVSDMANFLRNEKRPPLECHESLEGKTIVISGTTSGIGKETARLFAQKGAGLICLNRNPEKSAEQEREWLDRYNSKIKTILVDFSSLTQTKACARSLLNLEQPIDVLIHNCGIFCTRKSFSEDGIEKVFQINHLSSFYLNYLLKERLKKENRARVIYVNSEGHRFAMGGVHLKDLQWKYHLYTGLKSYGAAKTAQLLTMLRYCQFFENTGVSVNAMHPGNVKSHIGENNGKFYRKYKEKMILSSAKDPVISAKALLYLAASSEISKQSGLFYNLTTPEKPAPHARDKGKVEAVWNKSLQLCGLT